MFNHLDMLVFFGYVDKGREALAEPHGDGSVHVHTKGLEALLESTHGVVLESTGVLSQVHVSHLSDAHTAHRDETWRRVRRHWWSSQYRSKYEI